MASYTVAFVTPLASSLAFQRSRTAVMWESTNPATEDPHVTKILFVECGMYACFGVKQARRIPFLCCIPSSLTDRDVCFSLGFGADAHGQNSTKAAVRACRNAIEFNQIPSISDIVPGGRDNMKLDVLLAVPLTYQDGLDLNVIRACFPYGQVRFQIQDGGMVATNGKAIASMGDKNEDMVIVCTAVTVGY
jgi:uncharacterized protein (TIGR02058 family)